MTHGYSHGTRTHEHGYGFHVGVGPGGPKSTHGLPVTSTKSKAVSFAKSFPDNHWLKESGTLGTLEILLNIDCLVPNIRNLANALSDLNCLK